MPGAHSGVGLVAIIAAGLLFQPFDVLDHWFQSRLESRHAVVVRVGVALLIGACKVGLAWHRATLEALAWMSVAEAALVAAGLLGMYARKGFRERWRVARAEVWALARESAPLAATALLVMLFMRLDQLMLAKYVGFRELGIYAAAVRLVELWNFIPLAVLPSLYPVLVALRNRDEGGCARFLRRLLLGFQLMALGVVAVNAVAGKILLGMLFGAEYVGAAGALSILSVATVFTYSSSIRAQWMLVEHKVAYHLGAAAIGVGTLAALNAALIPRWGFLGAAVATVVGYAVSGYGTSWAFPALRPFGRMQTRALMFQGWSDPQAEANP